MKDTSDQAERGKSHSSPMTVAETLQLFSHDIRSAMSDVVGGLRLIDKDRLDPDTCIQLDRVQAAGDTLAALVDAALMAAAGDTLIQSDADELDLDAWLDAQTGRWSGRATEFNSAFRLDAGGALPDRLVVPQVTLDRIVGNLISNALNHADGASVCLRVTAKAGGGLTLSVADSGPGYPEAVLSQITERGEAPPMGDRAGSGLGLRIVAELSRQIGGRLDLYNAPGGGGVAALHLPEDRVRWQSQPGQTCTPPDLSGLRLLVAEDNLTNQTILRQILGTMNAEAVFVADGVAAVEMLEQQAFDLALIDIEMPRMSGIEVMRHIRTRDDAVSRMPLVALTAYVLRDNREAIYSAGADGIIGKPIASAPEFGRAILQHAGRPVGLPDPDDVLKGAAKDVGMGRKLDVERFQVLLETAEEAGSRDELLRRLCADLRAAEAVLAEAVADGNAPEIRAQTHILIAISGAVGAERLHRLSEVLNIAAKRGRMNDLAALHAPCAADLRDLINYVSRQDSSDR